MLTKGTKKRINVILITAMVGMGTITYVPPAFAESSVPIQEDQSINTLSKLEMEGIKLDKDFSADVKEYSATVENNMESINLLVESSNQDAVITINGESVTSETAGTLPLQTGENIFLITVKDGSHSENTYTLTVIRKESANNFLQSLKLSAGVLSPAFSAAVTNYTVQLTSETKALTVTPIAAEKMATVEVNGLSVKTEGVSVNIPTGKSDITIVVTAENGEKKTYTLHVTKAEETGTQASNPSKNNLANSSKNNPANPSENNLGTSFQNNRNNSLQATSFQQENQDVQKESKATLSALTVSEGTWDSSFVKNEFTYHIAVSSESKSITIQPTASYSDSTISIKGSSSNTIQLEEDHKTIISIVVKNGDDDRKTYVLVFDQADK
ncbi:cadherin-like beta sandwich domain-containing protein [Neobacillus jeddahensis]|uniref:cadherin-like beta sandwich domain-containing protein n=1 Tax=Neobacillus jeddahensis TaxID=1461580 RepID=UPI00058ED46F|nr:cadherin-like beta sandwich domain-containing protein [Neobacillus jeddahensis]